MELMRLARLLTLDRGGGYCVLEIAHKSARVARLRPADLTHLAFTSGESPDCITLYQTVTLSCVR